MRLFTVDYLKDAPRQRGQILNRGFFIAGLRRPIVVCRLFGHRPVVDGTISPIGQGGYQATEYRWVACGRCGMRGRPQGVLDPKVWAVDDRYLGPWDQGTPRQPENLVAWRDKQRGFTLPGPIGADDDPEGELGGQLVVGPPGFGGVGWEVKIGHGGSDHTLAAALYFGWLGVLYLHTKQIGTSIQRRLNPIGYHSRLIGFRVTSSEISWRLWSKRDSSRHDEPWWMHGRISVCWLNKMLGPDLRTFTDIPDARTTRFVHMPEGEYLTGLRLRRSVSGRARGRKRRSWSVEWDALAGGIPTKGPDRGRICGAGVPVSEESVRAGTWPAEAVAAIITQMTASRTEYGWEPIGLVPVPAEVAA